MAAVCFSLLSGRSASGGMHIDASGALLAMFTLPTLLCSAWAARRPGAARLAAWAGWTIAAVALWWVFWLPATLVDMAPGARYGADNRGIPLPATAFAVCAGPPLVDASGVLPLLVSPRSFDVVLMSSSLPAQKATDGPRRGLEPSVLARAPRHKRSRCRIRAGVAERPPRGQCAP